MEPVDLTNLRGMTDGDRELERALFEEFFSSFEAGIAVLAAHTGDAAAETWRKEAHALKGMALNLGAMALGALCKKAQEEPQANAVAKDTLLKSVRTEYAQVRAFLVRAMS